MKFASLLFTVLVLTGSPAFAGHQTCGGQVVPQSLRHCPDGSIPVYTADTLAAPQAAAPANRSKQAPPAQGAAAASDLFGIWHTSVSGGVWQSPSAVPGYDQLHVSPGVKAGDLTIDPSGRYVWNSYGGKVGNWQAGDADYPIVLIDTVERKRWKIGPDRRHPGKVFIWDGSVNYVGTR